MTKKQPAAKAKRVRKPEPFNPYPMAHPNVCECRCVGNRRAIELSSGWLIESVPAFQRWVNSAAAWVADAPKSKGAR